MTITRRNREIIIELAGELRTKAYKEGLAVGGKYGAIIAQSRQLETDNKIDELSEYLGTLTRTYTAEDPKTPAGGEGESVLPAWFQKIAEQASEEFKNLQRGRVPAWAQDAWSAMHDQDVTEDSMPGDGTSDSSAPNIDEVIELSQEDQASYIDTLTVKEARELYQTLCEERTKTSKRERKLTDFRSFLGNSVPRETLDEW